MNTQCRVRGTQYAVVKSQRPGIGRWVLGTEYFAHPGCRKALPLFLLLSLALAAPWSASAQPVNRWRDFRRAAQRTSDYLRNNDQIKGLVQPAVASASAATVRVTCDGRQVALGTVVDADGLILTKASQLGEKPQCRLADGRTLPAKLVGSDDATDLALLQVDAKNLTPVDWTDPPAPGSIVAATAPGSGLPTIGAISDVPQPMPGPPRDSRPHGWLGISVAPVDDGAEVQEITPGSAAEKAGLRNGDLIKRLDGEAIRSDLDLIGKLREMPANREVSLTVGRKDKDVELKATLSRGPGRLAQDHWGGGPFSDRRWGFGKVIPSDLGISPTDCGGPLVDLDGRCVGVNIARALRVASYALPASVAKETVEKLRQREVTAK